MIISDYKEFCLVFYSYELLNHALEKIKAFSLFNIFSGPTNNFLGHRAVCLYFFNRGKLVTQKLQSTRYHLRNNCFV